jgi:hypothetical protein
VIDQGAKGRRRILPDELSEAGDVRPDQGISQQDVRSSGGGCVLTWGRSLSVPPAIAIIASRFARTSFRSITSEGLRKREASFNR